MIVKVQRPLFGNDKSANDLYLVYAESRVRLRTQKVPQAVADWLDKRIDGKSFWHATWNAKKEQWDIGERASWQDW